MPSAYCGGHALGSAFDAVPSLSVSVTCNSCKVGHINHIVNADVIVLQLNAGKVVNAEVTKRVRDRIQWRKQ